VDVSVESAIAARLDRSISKRFSISAAKCCASAAEPPLPQLIIFPPAWRHRIIRSAARAIGGASASLLRSLTSALSEK
jgi:hypothetical protein